MLISIIKFIFQARKARIQSTALGGVSSKAKATEIRISRMIFTVVAIFMICNSFALIAYSAVDIGGYEFYAYILNAMGKFITAINASVNAVVYGIFNNDYRDEFLKYFCGKSYDQENNTYSIAMTARPIVTTLKTESPNLRLSKKIDHK